MSPSALSTAHSVTDPAAYDVVIVGGSSAGLSAALLLGRSLRRVLVIDSGRPCNRQTPHSHGFMTRDGATPAQLVALAREQAAAYPTVTLRNDGVRKLARREDGFLVTTDQQSQFRARKLLLATGVEDLLLPIEGFAECWGKSVLHCPYCHGYEVHGQPLGLLGNGEAGAELVRLIQHWSPQLTLFTNGPATLTAEQRQLARSLGVGLIETPVVGIEHDNGFMRAVRLQDGAQVELTAMFARVPFRQPSDLAEQLGCELTPAGLLAVAEFGQTTVPGVYAAGDNSSPLRQVTMASGSGVKAASFLNREMIEEDLAKKVVPYG